MGRGFEIPWHEPGFSERMLAEHLSQAHDAASRRLGTVDAQVGWIHDVLLGGESSRVLDLGCGPGLYANRFARLGHTVHGIDFSPASIRYARAQCEGEQLTARFALADIRSAEYGSGYDWAMLLYGELNAFKRDDAPLVLTRIRQSLRDGGHVLLEPHTFASLQSTEGPSNSWRSLERGLFSDRPHLLLEESFWDPDGSVRIHRWFVVHAETGEVEQHLESMQAYTDAGYLELLEEAGFRNVETRKDWPAAQAHEGTLTALIATA